MIELKKRLISWVLVVGMLLAMLPGTVWAADTADDETAYLDEALLAKSDVQLESTEDVQILSDGTVDSGTFGDSLTWVLDTSGTLTISGSGEMAFPGLAPWFSYTYKITSVIIEAGVTSICSHAFSECTQLTSITIPDSVTSIGGRAFANCSSLASITIPNSVTTIGSDAFISCSSLTSINIPASVTNIEEGAFTGCSSIIAYSVDSANTAYQSIDGVIFDDRKLQLIAYPAGNSSSSYSIPEGVTYIASDAFYGSSNLTEITIPDSVFYLGHSSFAECDGLTSVSLSQNVIHIVAGAFRYCRNLTELVVDPENPRYTSIDGVLFDKEITTLMHYPAGNAQSYYEIPATVTSIDYYAFSYSSNLKTVVIPNSVTSIAQQAFYCSGLTSIVIPDSVEIIDGSVFYDCSNLTSIVIPDSVTSIGSYAFYGCTSLASVSIPDSVTSIGMFAFNDCTSLATVSISNSITTLEYGTFRNCSSLTNVTIPASVQSIDSSVFNGCSNLAIIYISEGLTSIGTYAFFGCNRLAVVYYTGTTDKWSEISIDIKNEALSSANIHYNYIYESYSVSKGLDGAAIITISENAITQAVEQAAITGNLSIDLTSASSSDEQESNTVILPGNLISALDTAYAEASLSITTDTAKITMDSGVVATMAENIGSTSDSPVVTVGVATVEQDTLAEEQKAAISQISETALVLNLTMTVTNGDDDTATSTVLHELNGDVEVCVPYTLPEGAEGKHVSVCYVADNGAITYQNATYDDGYVTFTTDHFSTFVIGTSSYELSVVESIGTKETVKLTAYPAEDPVFVQLVLAVYDKSDRMIAVSVSEAAELSSGAYTTLSVEWSATQEVGKILAFLLTPESLVPLRGVQRVR
jgi:hypothetical protein